MQASPKTLLISIPIGVFFQLYLFVAHLGIPAGANPSSHYNVSNGTGGGENTILRFDPDIEALELKKACNPRSSERSSAESYGAVSRYLLAHCKR